MVPSIVEDLKRDKVLGTIADELLALQRLSITLMTDSPGVINRGVSKLGGLPDFPETISWPTVRLDRNPLRTIHFPENAPMPDGEGTIVLPFIAQIRLSDVKPFDTEDLLPDKGMLYFFFNGAFYPGFDDYYSSSKNWLVIYHKDESECNNVGKPPLLLPDDFIHDPVGFNSFSKEITIPNTDMGWVEPYARAFRKKVVNGQTVLEITEKQYGALHDFLAKHRFYGRSMHQMLGHPDLIQEWHISKSDRLLLQIDFDSDKYLDKINNSGKLYFIITESDLRNTDFSKVRAAFWS